MSTFDLALKEDNQLHFEVRVHHWYIILKNKILFSFLLPVDECAGESGIGLLPGHGRHRPPQRLSAQVLPNGDVDGVSTSLNA